MGTSQGPLMVWYPSEWDILKNHQRMFLSFGYYLSIKKTHRSLVARPQKSGSTSK